MKLSLRARLFLWMTIAVLLISLGLTFLTEQVTVWNMEGSIDDSLQKRAHMVAAIISSDITTDEASYAKVMGELTEQQLPFVPLLLRIVSPRGKVIAEFGKVPAPVVGMLEYHLQQPGIDRGHFDNIVVENQEPLRAYTVSVSDPRTGEALARVQIVESLELLQETKRELWRNGLILALAGSFLAMAVGTLVIRRGFRALGDILQAINRIDYSHLKAKLDDQTRPAELEQLAKSLTAMWQRLDLAVRDRQKLIGSVSHDIRTPLTALQGHLEMLLLQPSLSPEVRGSLTRMLEETRRLIRLVKNLLLNVQLESKPSLVPEEVNLRDLLDEVAGDMWTLTEGLRFDVVAPLDVEVHGDRDLLKQMLMNIVDNAVKFTSRGGKVELKLGSEDEWAVIEVTDTGRGIASEDMPHVTEAFYRPSKSRRSVAEGAGLGLSIVKQVVELHGGRLDIKSQEHVGTSVKVLLPRRLLVVLPGR